MSERICTECAYCGHYATGYSEYTIMGEDLRCIKGQPLDISTEMNTEAEIDKAVSIAKDCPHFTEGTGPRLGLYTDDDEREMADWAKVNGLDIPEEFAKL